MKATYKLSLVIGFVTMASVGACGSAETESMSVESATSPSTPAERVLQAPGKEGALGGTPETNDSSRICCAYCGNGSVVPLYGVTANCNYYVHNVCDSRGGFVDAAWHTSHC
jgi:hypothetical protein